ncbi:hypothetical protein BDK51DRAFT_29638, partial [Blyttiomyces helicus]
MVGRGDFQTEALGGRQMTQRTRVMKQVSCGPGGGRVRPGKRVDAGVRLAASSFQRSSFPNSVIRTHTHNGNSFVAASPRLPSASAYPPLFAPTPSLIYSALHSLIAMFWTKRRILLTVGLASLGLLTVFISGLSFTRVLGRATHNIVSINRPAPAGPALNFNSNVTLVDSNSGSFQNINRPITLKVHFDITPLGPVVDQASHTQVKAVPAGPIVVTFDTTTYGFPAGRVVASQNILFQFSIANPSNYPFDVYVDDFFIIATWSNPVTNQSENLPISMGLENQLGIWNMAMQLSNARNATTAKSTLFPTRFTSNPRVIDISGSGLVPGIVAVHVEFTRSWMIRFFAIGIFLLMWLLSFAILVLAVSLCWRRRKVEPPTIAVTLSMLFALPTVRNIMPGIPPLGIIFD